MLVDAVFDRMSVMSAAQLRELAGLLPQAAGNKGKLPPLPDYLPKRALGNDLEEHDEVHSGAGCARSDGIAAARFGGGFQIGRGSSDRQVSGDGGRCNADARRISDAADCGGETAPD